MKCATIPFVNYIDRDWRVLSVDRASSAFALEHPSNFVTSPIDLFTLSVFTSSRLQSQTWALNVRHLYSFPDLKQRIKIHASKLDLITSTRSLPIDQRKLPRCDQDGRNQESIRAEGRHSESRTIQLGKGRNSAQPNTYKNQDAYVHIYTPGNISTPFAICIP